MRRIVFGDTAALKQQLSHFLSAQRAHNFHGTHPQATFQFAAGPDDAHQIDDIEKGTIIKSLHLHTLHAALSAQRTAWAVIQTMVMALESDFQQEFGDEAMTYFSMLAANPPGGSIENVTHEHVADMISQLKGKLAPDSAAATRPG